MKTYFKELRYAFYVIVHPFDGFWDLKHEKRGGLKAAMTILAAVVITFVFTRRYTGFIFNQNNLNKMNNLTDILGVLLVFLLWAVSNWSLTTLMDGKGTFKDIVIFSAYALLPYVIIGLPMLLCSWMFSLDEASIYQTFITISYVWSGFLLLIGTMVTHDHTLGKTVLTVVGIFIAMALIVFLALLLSSIVQDMISLVLAIYKEINFRL